MSFLDICPAEKENRQTLTKGVVENMLTGTEEMRVDVGNKDRRENLHQDTVQLPSVQPKSLRITAAQVPQKNSAPNLSEYQRHKSLRKRAPQVSQNNSATYCQLSVSFLYTAVVVE